jgi:hypothetical protein
MSADPSREGRPADGYHLRRACASCFRAARVWWGGAFLVYPGHEQARQRSSGPCSRF